MICADCPINSVAEYQAEIARLRQQVERLVLNAREACAIEVFLICRDSDDIGDPYYWALVELRKLGIDSDKIPRVARVPR